MRTMAVPSQTEVPPRPHGPLVSRPRLLARLDHSLQGSLTLISAPAGFGKTTLLAQWAETIPIPTAWVRLTAADRELPQFTRHLRAALQAAGVDADRLDERALPTSRASPAAVGEAWADALAGLTPEIVLIVDDFHLAASIAVEQFLTGFLADPPPTLHLALATRSDPFVPLARLRLHGLLAEVRAADLRFTEAEAVALLATAGTGADDPAWIAALHARTEGWVAGLRMALLSIDPAAPARAPVPDQYVMDFLLEEVLAQQPAATQESLLRFSIVDRLSPALAAVLLEVGHDEAAAALEHAARRGLFLEADGDGAWWQFHALFRRLLRQQLERHHAPGAIAALHLRASAWFAGHDLLAEAIRHRAAAGDMAGAAHLIEEHVDATLAREDWPTLSGWLQLLPEAVVARSPRLLLARAWVGQVSGRMTPMRATLEAVTALLAGRTDADAVALRCECDLLAMVTMAMIEQDPDAVIARARQAIEHLPSERRFPLGHAVLSLGCALHASGRTDDALRWLTNVANQEEAQIDAASLRALMGAYFVQTLAGHLDAAADIAQQALALAEREDLPLSRGWAHWTLGWVAYEHDALEEAEEHFRAIINDRRRVHLTNLCEALMGLALIAQAHGDSDGADAAFQQCRAAVLAANALEYLPWLRSFEATLALRRGHAAEAIVWLQAQHAAVTDSTLLIRTNPFLVQIRARIAEGSPGSLDQARAELAIARAHAVACHATGALIAIGILDALALEARGDHAAALAALAAAQALGRPGGYRRTFLDFAPAISPLLAAPYPTAPEGSPTASDPIQQIPEHDIVDILTAREAEVLAMLSQRLTYREIAVRMFISPETVKTHTSNIYAKLGVVGRREALDRAHELGLIA